ncbi:putative protein kinase RLK-Pelle-CrRLK1L-1 family [Helianthus annuus]|nr:putative protein kinase RLK-Pelle-CrRLK1L-1 family [Helianthus annuus]
MLFTTGETSTSSSRQPCRQFEFSEILTATENFDESLVIGNGGFGKVYRGNIIYGSSFVVAAIKRLDSMSNQGAVEFWAEVEMLSMLRHCNLVSLIGYCNYGKEMILVYDYMPNGTLDYHLHKLCSPLSWLQRLNISIGAGRGLHYLHTGTGIASGVIHRDVKSSNILLHESWTAKVSDFGLSKIGPINQPSTYVNTLIKGTFGYMDPDYFTTGRLTRKSDVYAFGVVLLEVLCRKRAVDRSLDEEQWGLVTWAQDSIKEGNLKHIVDSDIRGEISEKCLKEFIRIAERCLHNSPRQRPTMAEVVVTLESVLDMQEKFNNSLLSKGRTIFGRVVDMFFFHSYRENSVKGDSKLSGNSKGSNTFSDLKDVPAQFQNPSWVDRNTLSPSKQGIGLPVAIKRLHSESFRGHAEWLAELISLLEHLDHPNIIRLLGYCIQKQEHLLIYEYMPNKGFDRLLFTDISQPLSWGTRLLILIGVARGLVYLHSSKLIHRDLNCSHILVDEDFNAKLGGFGLAKYGPGTQDTSTRVSGSMVYLDPEYYMTGHLNWKSDIYAFGMVLLESMTGRRALDLRRLEGQQSLIDWASTVQINRRNLKEIVDLRLEDNYPLQGASECFALALRCVAKEYRPSSEEVLQSLEQIYALHK